MYGPKFLVKTTSETHLLMMFVEWQEQFLYQNDNVNFSAPNSRKSHNPTFPSIAANLECKGIFNK